jgi:hypothetical protein
MSHNTFRSQPEAPKGADMKNIADTLAFLLILFEVLWAIWVAHEMRRLETFMRSRYDRPITCRQFLTEVAGRFLLISTYTSLSVPWYLAGLVAGNTSAEMYHLWTLHVFHTCMLGSIAILRFQRIFFEPRCGKVWLFRLVKYVDLLSHFYITMIVFKQLSTIITALESWRHALSSGTISLNTLQKRLLERAIST